MALENLIPCQDKHSIKEAVLSVFLQNPIVKPSQFKSLITDNETIKNSFQEFRVAGHVKVTIRQNDEKLIPDIDHNLVEDKGFTFNRFEEGEKVSVLQGLNDPQKVYISLHLLQYTTWEAFFSNFKDYLGILNDFQKGMYVIGFGLQYIDEFKWNDNSALPVKDIFNQTSDLLPNVFFTDDTNQYSLVRKLDEPNLTLDRLEINKIQSSVSSVLVLSHNTTELYNEPIAMDAFLAKPHFNSGLKAHENNKSLLRQILQKEVLDKINLSL